MNKMVAKSHTALIMALNNINSSSRYDRERRNHPNFSKFRRVSLSSQNTAVWCRIVKYTNIRHIKHTHARPPPFRQGRGIHGAYGHSKTRPSHHVGSGRWTCTISILSSLDGGYSIQGKNRRRRQKLRQHACCYCCWGGVIVGATPRWSTKPSAERHNANSAR